jgi:hypothetical protein
MTWNKIEIETSIAIGWKADENPFLLRPMMQLWLCQAGEAGFLMEGAKDAG